mmetsp:Transcript_7648/g.8786  ORF Transcript_7648/g.8786 Transcript_7648/m.8786 type:complete len:93 (-) Transcript_7648:92-370(-)
MTEKQNLDSLSVPQLNAALRFLTSREKSLSRAKDLVLKELDRVRRESKHVQESPVENTAEGRPDEETNEIVNMDLIDDKLLSLLAVELDESD